MSHFAPFSPWFHSTSGQELIVGCFEDDKVKAANKLDSTNNWVVIGQSFRVGATLAVALAPNSWLSESHQ